MASDATAKLAATEAAAALQQHIANKMATLPAAE
jgi:hypothetical protein